ncbi:carbon-nitrogen hydrolase [Lentinula aff. detonsa]|uniref:Carbon-nitrogen hydrolase n=1 Tax=Lentinula aff. detonsa TaxID=2804958 RepID=A0AA38NTJ8_9AGAR|nr:carbon-nitrogen hydrolase [Lentinula aff. detonsa]
MSSSRIVRASVVQACTPAYSLTDTLDKMERLTRLASERDRAQIAVFPEAFIGGYPKMSTFGVVVGDRSDLGREEFLKYYNAAIDIPSPAITRIEQISKETGVFIVTGVIERDLGTLYCTAIFVSPVHGFVGKHRKLVPTAAERLIWGQGDGSTLPVLETSFLPTAERATEVTTKISASICWYLRTYYYSQGTQLYCAPTVDARPAWQNSMVHIAIEGRCFVLSACQFAQEKDYPADHAVADVNARHPDNVMIAGGSVIVSPLGKILAGPLLGEEGVLSADLDLDDCIRGKFDLDTTGHYARPDVFELKANIY